MVLPELHFIPVTAGNSGDYLDLGIQSYNQHYLHLWHNADPSGYFNSYFTEEAIAKEIELDGLMHFIVKRGSDSIGIIKLNDERPLHPFQDESILLLEKIYFLEQYSGQGYGKRALEKIEMLTHDMGKRWLWLETMQKGQAKYFYLNRGFEVLKETRLNYPNAIDEERPMFVLIKDLKAS